MSLSSSEQGEFRHFYLAPFATVRDRVEHQITAKLIDVRHR